MLLGPFIDAFQSHFFIVVVSVGLAAATVIPLGIWARSRPVASTMILGFDNLISTVPSVALYGLLMPLLAIWDVGIGTVPAVIALFLYSQLPMLRNTLVGLQNIDPSIVDAAIGMGMTERQILFKIRLPLATPMIMAGLRTSAVMGTGVASIAAYIGAGGFGTYIIRGIAASNRHTILIGAFGASAMAIGIDFLLGGVQKILEGRIGKR